jgi:hypothetical protein
MTSEAFLKDKILHSHVGFLPRIGWCKHFEAEAYGINVCLPKGSGDWRAFCNVQVRECTKADEKKACLIPSHHSALPGFDIDIQKSRYQHSRPIPIPFQASIHK